MVSQPNDNPIFETAGYRRQIWITALLRSDARSWRQKRRCRHKGGATRRPGRLEAAVHHSSFPAFKEFLDAPRDSAEPSPRSPLGCFGYRGLIADRRRGLREPEGRFNHHRSASPKRNSPLPQAPPQSCSIADTPQGRRPTRSTGRSRPAAWRRRAPTPTGRPTPQ